MPRDRDDVRDDEQSARLDDEHPDDWGTVEWANRIVDDDRAHARATLEALLAGQTPEGRMLLATQWADAQARLSEGRHVCRECGLAPADPAAHSVWHGTLNAILRGSLGLAPMPDPISRLDRELGALLASLDDRPHLSVVRDEVNR